MIDVRLGEFADRVITTIRIAPQYTYLLRQNSVFWNVSGLDMSIGITGANVKAGTFDSMLRGGITFATPEQKQLTPAAPEGILSTSTLKPKRNGPSGAHRSLSLSRKR